MVVEPVSAVPTITISQLYERVNRVITREFKEPLWVTGEIRNAHSSQSGHFYMDLADPHQENAVIKVVCWRSIWLPMERYLRSIGIEISEGMVVNVFADLKVYPGKGAIQLYLKEIDVEALLGRIAAHRAKLIHQLTREGLIDRNKQLPVPLVPLRIGLVASPGTEGYKDFVRQLFASGFSFHITLRPSEVQGKNAPTSLELAIKELAAQPLDLLVLVRGGGSKADLSSFDEEPVARAIATSPLPVWVGIGHTGDSSVADRVANKSLATPTECGRELVQLVSKYFDYVAHTGERIGQLITKELAAIDTTVDRARDDVARLVRLRLRLAEKELIDLSKKLSESSIKIPDIERGLLIRTSEKIVRTAHSSCQNVTSYLQERAERVARNSQRIINSSAQELDHFRQLLSAYDYQRQLERGYTVTLDSRGGILREASKLKRGERIVTRFARGSTTSSVEEVSETAIAITPTGYRLPSDSPDTQ